MRIHFDPRNILKKLYLVNQRLSGHSAIQTAWRHEYSMPDIHCAIGMGMLAALVTACHSFIEMGMNSKINMNYATYYGPQKQYYAMAWCIGKCISVSDTSSFEIWFILSSSCSITQWCHVRVQSHTREHTPMEELKHNKYWHDDVIKCKHFPRNWPFVRETTSQQWIPLTKARDVELWCFLPSMPEKKNSWANYRDASVLRCHHTHYDITVM